MPNIINYKYRYFCKNCNDFTLHIQVYKSQTDHPSYSLIKFDADKEDDAHLICECGCQYTTVKVKDIPSDKLQAQRKRFRQYRTERFKRTLNVFNMLNDERSMFSPVFGAETKIVESDAGLENEEKLIKQEEQRIKDERTQELIRFKNVGRNDDCLCGSTLKYKKCCLPKHNKY